MRHSTPRRRGHNKGAWRVPRGPWDPPATSGTRRCIQTEKASEAAPEAVQQAVGGCQSGWGRSLSVTHAFELSVREAVAWHRLGALEGGGYPPSPANASLAAPFPLQPPVV